MAVIQHMNDDHSDSLELYVRAFATETCDLQKRSAIDVEMIDIDLTAVTLRVTPESEKFSVSQKDAELVRLTFADTIALAKMENAEDSRRVLVEMVKVARQRLGLSGDASTASTNR